MRTLGEEILTMGELHTIRHCANEGLKMDAMEVLEKELAKATVEDIRVICAALHKGIVYPSDVHRMVDRILENL